MLSATRKTIAYIMLIVFKNWNFISVQNNAKKARRVTSGWPSIHKGLKLDIITFDIPIVIFVLLFYDGRM